ncbi:unnamed protein product [Rotaria sp. Silwood2]|nr:unnamed protein product [Rotaria sp. Silwood2]
MSVEVINEQPQLLNTTHKLAILHAIKWKFVIALVTVVIGAIILGPILAILVLHPKLSANATIHFTITTTVQRQRQARRP